MFILCVMTIVFCMFYYEFFFFFKQKTAYEMRISDWSSDVCSSDLWLIVPLIHLERLAGFLLLERSPVVADLNWEDFDLLRTVGQQAASYIAEAQSQSALADAEKFEEFNRRRSEEHTSALQSLMRISYAVLCLKKIHKKNTVFDPIYII